MKEMKKNKVFVCLCLVSSFVCAAEMGNKHGDELMNKGVWFVCKFSSENFGLKPSGSFPSRYPHVEDCVWRLRAPVSDFSPIADLPSSSDPARLHPRADHPELDDQQAEGTRTDKTLCRHIPTVSYSVSLTVNSLHLPETAAAFQH